MRGVFLLAWRYLAHTRWRSLLIAVAVALAVLLPLTVHLLVGAWSAELGARARATPIVVGAKGSRFDLVLRALYFRGRVPAPVAMGERHAAEGGGLAQVVPLLATHSARGYPVVGTTPEYYERRGLAPARGSLPLVLGDCVLGAEVAAALGLGPGGRLLSDQRNLYDLGKGYPLRMLVAGVLAPAGTPDDGAVFVGLETAWLLEGIAHGHADATQQEPGEVLGRDGQGLVLAPSIVEYSEVRPDNLASFHLHGERDELPLSALLAWPRSAKAATLLKGRYRLSQRTQLLEPAEVVEELLGFVVRAKRFFDANALLVLVATALLLGVVVALGLEARRGEMRTLARIGCSKGTLARIVATELALLVAAGALLAGVLATLALPLARRLL